MKNKMTNSLSDIIMYNKPDGSVNAEILVQDETLWMQQSRIAELFDVDRTVISKHLKNVFAEGELDENSVCAKIAHTAADGKTYNTKFYNLDAILSVGYRVNSRQATMFRIFTTQVLKEYLIKGFAMNDERLKNPENINFFATVQNKLHYATTNHTAAEIVYERANSEKENMGLTTWKNAPDGAIRKSDVSIAKNYLAEDKIKNLKNIGWSEIRNMYLTLINVYWKWNRRGDCKMNTNALRQKILDLAIRGKLVPQDPNDEPASVLLERIRAEKQQMVKEGKLKAKDIKNDTIIFQGEDNLHYVIIYLATEITAGIEL